MVYVHQVEGFVRGERELWCDKPRVCGGFDAGVAALLRAAVVERESGRLRFAHVRFLLGHTLEPIGAGTVVVRHVVWASAGIGV